MDGFELNEGVILLRQAWTCSTRRFLLCASTAQVVVASPDVKGLARHPAHTRTPMAENVDGHDPRQLPPGFGRRPLQPWLMNRLLRALEQDEGRYVRSGNGQGQSPHGRERKSLVIARGARPPTTVLDMALLAKLLPDADRSTRLSIIARPGPA